MGEGAGSWRDGSFWWRVQGFKRRRVATTVVGRAVFRTRQALDVEVQIGNAAPILYRYNHTPTQPGARRGGRRRQYMLIDVSRLVGRFLKGRLPTGVDRVCQAYLAHYGSQARALVRIGRHNLVFNHRISTRIFNTLQGAPTRTKIQYANRILRGIATGGLSRCRRGPCCSIPGTAGWRARVITG